MAPFPESSKKYGKLERMMSGSSDP